MLGRGKVKSQKDLRRKSFSNTCMDIGIGSSSSQGHFIISCSSTTNRSPRMPRASGYVCSEDTVNCLQPMLSFVVLWLGF